MKFYTYIHRRKDTNEVFYIGKGSSHRIYATGKYRGKYWNNIVNKHGRTVEYVAYWENEQDAYEHEKFLIQVFREMGSPLINKNDGGDGGRHWQGKKRDPETNAKISAKLKGRKRDQKSVEKGKETRSKRTYAKRFWTEEQRAARRGDKNPAAIAAKNRYNVEDLKWMYEHSYPECREKYNLTDHQIKDRKRRYKVLKQGE
jgi:hypothetical protein